MAQAAFDGNLPAELLDQAAHQRQAQARAGVRHGIEAVKDGAQPVGLDAAPGVAHRELDCLFQLFGGEQNFAVRRGIAQGIGEQVVEDPVEREGVHLDGGRRFAMPWCLLQLQHTQLDNVR